ncbi:MAG: hypothetical protein GX155_07985 [Smithella sp.]|nr:hypothetical protein [Smithella sp.]
MEREKITMNHTTDRQVSYEPKTASPHKQVNSQADSHAQLTSALNSLTVALKTLESKIKEGESTPDFPLAHMLVYVAPRGRADALAHKPQNQARFLRGTDNSK